ncbi:hypothetical protein Pelo_18084 [Pelomyxa schiedti]|nr:hypothetical protein Pelo_18084 [Pelomyxa schiedti]
MLETYEDNDEGASSGAAASTSTGVLGAGGFTSLDTSFERTTSVTTTASTSASSSVNAISPYYYTASSSSTTSTSPMGVPSLSSGGGGGDDDDVGGGGSIFVGSGGAGNDGNEDDGDLSESEFISNTGGGGGRTGPGGIMGMGAAIEGMSATDALLASAELQRHATSLVFATDVSKFHSCGYSISVSVASASCSSDIKLAAASPSTIASVGGLYTISSKHVASGDQFHVVRSYIDFLSLHEQFKYMHGSFVLPPLPEVIASRFSSHHIEYRTHILQQYLYRLASHPVLLAEDIFMAFLKAKKLPPIPPARQPVLPISIKVPALGKGKDSDKDPFFNGLYSKLDSMQATLAPAVSAGMKLGKHWTEMKDAYIQVSNGIHKTGEIHETTSPTISQCCKHICSASETVVALLQKELIGPSLPDSFEEQLRDHSRMVQEMKNLVNRRHEVKEHYLAFNRAVAVRREKVTKLKGTSSEEIARREFLEVEKLCNRAKEEFDDFTVSAKQEVERANSVLHSQMFHSLRLFVSRNADFHSQMSSTWASTATACESVSFIESPPPSSTTTSASTTTTTTHSLSPTGMITPPSTSSAADSTATTSSSATFTTTPITTATMDMLTQQPTDDTAVGAGTTQDTTPFDPPSSSSSS